MNTTAPQPVNRLYLISVSLFTFIIPLAGFITEHLIQHVTLTFVLFGKWFIFSAVGLRLLAAGIKQAADPAFTAKQIFEISGTESYPILRELGFANICFGAVGILSLFFPGWRIVSAFGSGLYYGIAGAMHLVKKPAGKTEFFALVTDIIIFAVLLAYFIVMI